MQEQTLYIFSEEEIIRMLQWHVPKLNTKNTKIISLIPVTDGKEFTLQVTLQDAS